MAKDLPYFKFFCSEWNDGDITLEDYKVQGLFINICSYYWSNECKLTFNKVQKKFKDSPEDLWQTLLDSNIIKKVNKNLVITFLDEQRDERLKRSKVRSKGGKASAEARKLKKLQQETNKDSTQNQHVLKSCSTQVQVLRREEKRKEEKREEESEDVLKNIDTLLIEYKSNEKLITAICESQELDKVKLFEYLDEFNKNLKSQSRFTESWSEYTKYFLSWVRIKKNYKSKGVKKFDTKNQFWTDKNGKEHFRMG